MILYEVNIEVDAAIGAQYRAWLEAHIGEILTLPGFVSAELFEPLEPPPGPARLAYCVQYRLRDEAALAGYLRDHAARLRADGEARFGGRFNASRRVLRQAESACAR